MVERLPPHSIDAEEAVVGSLLIDGGTIELVADFLQAQQFYSERAKYVYEACLSLYQRGTPINQISLAEELNNRGKLEAAGGAAYLSYLVTVCVTSLDIEHHADTVRRLAGFRKLIEIAGEIAAIGYSAGGSLEDASDKAKTLLDELMPPRSRHLHVSNLRIIKSKPRHYIVELNGEDMSLARGELLNKGKFKAKVVDERDFIPILPKDWDGFIGKLLSQAKEMEAPVDTSADIEIKLSVKRWFQQRGEGTEYSDLQSGCYAVVPYRGKETGFEQREYWAFQPTPLLRWLKRDLGKVVTKDTLWAMALGWGAVKWQWRIGKSASIPAKLWALPPSFAEADEFAMEKEERQEELPTEEREGEEELPNF